MVEQVQRRVGQAPEQWLVDGSFCAHEQIDAVVHKTELYAPVLKAKSPKSKDQTKDGQDGESGQASEAEQTASASASASASKNEFTPRSSDSLAVAQWRNRMNTDEARTIYKDRAATAECVNAQARNRGLLPMPLRGLPKVKSVVGLFVLAHNLMRMAQLAPQLIGWRTTPCASTAMAC